MIIKSAEIVMSAVNKDQYPKDDKSIIAFAGRSNVGKSSLINSILNRKSLARVSSSPGKTRTINYYLINEKFYLVDLPGYGYAKMSKNEVKNFDQMMGSFFQYSDNLKSLFLLLDCRHEPKKTDIHMYDFCKYYDIDMEIILTKSDKISRNKYPKVFKTVRETIDLESNIKMYMHSSLKKEGTDQILELIEKIIHT